MFFTPPGPKCPPYKDPRSITHSKAYDTMALLFFGSCEAADQALSEATFYIAKAAWPEGRNELRAGRFRIGFKVHGPQILLSSLTRI